MIAMMETSHDLKVCSAELGVPVEQLFTPLRGAKLRDETSNFAIDNGAYSKFDVRKFQSLLDRLYDHRERCRFVACPDVVGDARRTLEVFDVWAPRLSEWTLALVAQNGQEDLPIPWDRIGAVFIGGTTAWKMSPHAASIVKAAKCLGLWVHAGRVNTPSRFAYFQKMGADSIDGTGLSLYSHMRLRVAEKQVRPGLWDGVAASGGEDLAQDG